MLQKKSNSALFTGIARGLVSEYFLYRVSVEISADCAALCLLSATRWLSHVFTHVIGSIAQMGVKRLMVRVPRHKLLYTLAGIILNTLALNLLKGIFERSRTSFNKFRTSAKNKKTIGRL